MHSPHSARGFTLLETLVATSILVTALAGLAQLFVLSSQLARQAGVAGAALVAAQDKLEALRGQTFAYDSAGAAVTDAALRPSPSNALSSNVTPYVDWLDPSGTARSDAASAIFVRRWRISPIDLETPDAVAIEVCVYRAGDDADVRQADACLSTIRSRQP
jgi:prepilin-type N-terminal cleavage/methylation domain-containing protein